eukprot:5738714-Pyramimonas_sp.AAC.1
MSLGNACADVWAGTAAQWAWDWHASPPAPRADPWGATAALVRPRARRALLSRGPVRDMPAPRNRVSLLVWMSPRSRAFTISRGLLAAGGASNVEISPRTASCSESPRHDVAICPSPRRGTQRGRRGHLPCMARVSRRSGG